MSTMGSQGERIICRLFLRHRCTRGDMCPFHHPQYHFNPDSSTFSWLTFCPEFKMGRCFQQDCRFFHITKEEEDVYRFKKDIAPTLLEQAMRKALLLDVALTGTRATCKGFLQGGGCSLTYCPNRHITRHEFANEVLNTLRNEFEIVLGSSGSDTAGTQPLLSERKSMAGSGGQNPLGAFDMNEEARLKRLKGENNQIFAALDPNQKASNLEEIRARLLALQAALQWKEDNDSSMDKGGLINDGLPPGMAVMNYGHNDPGFSDEPNIDAMRLQRNPPLAQTNMLYGLPGNSMSVMDNFSNPVMEFSQRNSTLPELNEYKLFIGGLTDDTETRDIENHFSKYGRLTDAVVMKDGKRNKSRGFGFVTYARSHMAEDALRCGPHRIRGKTVDVKLATPRDDDDKGPSRSDPPRRRSRSPGRGGGGGGGRKQNLPKLFIGGLSDEVTTPVLERYFKRYGKIVDVVSMQDPKTKRPRGFGFVEFAEENSVQDALTDCPHQICGCNVTVDRSQPREGDRKKEEPSKEEPCKLFVGGLNYTTDEDTLKKYFSRFGDIVDINIQRDSRGESKGYGFVIYSEHSMVNDANECGPHELDGRRVDTGFAVARGGGKKDDNKDRKSRFDRDRSERSLRGDRRKDDDKRGDNSGESYQPCKMFVGGLYFKTDEKSLHDYFTKYGDIKETKITMDNKGKSRGYGFVTFTEEVSVQDAMDSGPHEIDGRTVNLGSAIERANNSGDRRKRDRSESPDSDYLKIKAERTAERKKSHLD